MPERGSRRREEDIGETWPDLPEWATADALDAEVRRDLRGLSKEGADWVAAHLVAAGALADDEPELAWRHARAARARGGRIGVVRETVGLVAYRAGEWAEAIGELRAARRMGGGPGHLAVMADCERALGHPERAIELSRSAEADALDPEAVLELSIVVAGARADLDQIDAALAHLERIGLETAEQHPRLAYAYADLLLKAGRQAEAISWFIRSANADAEEETDALERVEFLSAEPEQATDDDAERVVASDLDDETDPDDAPDLDDDDLDQEADLDDDIKLNDEEADEAELDVGQAPDIAAAGRTDSGDGRDWAADFGDDDDDLELIRPALPENDNPITDVEQAESRITDSDHEGVTAADAPGSSEAPADGADTESDAVIGVPTLLFSDDPQAGDR